MINYRVKEIKDLQKSKPHNTLHIYCRVSTEIQKTDGSSLETQLKSGIKTAKNNKMDWMVWNEGARSGSSNLQDRVEFNNLMMECRNGNVKNIFFLDISRASRKYEYEYILLKTCQDYDVQLFDLGKKYDLKNDTDMMIIRLQSMFVQFENKQRRMKGMMGKRDHFLRGGWRGGITPFGFDTIERKLVINKEESKWVKKIFEMYSESYSTSEISNLLYSKGVKPRKSQSGIFNIGTIAVMLKNEIYIGIDRMKDPDEPEKILVYKNVPKIVDKKTFTICQNLLKLNKRNNKPTNKKTKKFPVLLRKMIRCGCCGEMWGVRLQHNVKSYQYYCRNKENKWSSRSPQRIIPECKVKRSCSIQQLDELVWRTVVRVNEESNILREKDKTKILQPINPNQSRSWKQRLNYLTKTIKDLEKKRMFLYEQFVSNEIDKEMLESLSKGIKSQVKDYQGQMTILEDNIKIKQDKDGFIDWVKKRHNKIEKMSQITDFDKRLQLVKEFVNRVELDHDKKKNRFMVNIILNLPLFNDKLLWKNKKDKKQGYTIEEGNYSEVIPFEIQSRTHFELVSSEPKKN